MLVGGVGEKVTAETIKEHLNSLGYENVPEDVLLELAQELNDSLILTTTPSKDIHVKDIPSKDIPTRIVEITRDEVVGQLNALGYDESSLPEDVLDELVRELNQSLSFNEQKHEKNIQKKDEKVDFASVYQTVKNQRQEFEHFDHFEQEQAQDDDDGGGQSGYQNQSNFDKDEEELKHLHSLVNQQRQHLKQQQQQLSQLQPKRASEKKKTDPVRLYHQFRNYWDNDAFIQRLSNPSAPKSKERMFGGLGYHAVMGGSRVSVPTKPQSSSHSTKRFL